MFDTDIAKTFIAACDRKAAAEKELEDAKAELAEAEEALLRQFEMEPDMNGLKLQGRTLFVKQNIYASPKESREEVVTALKADGYEQYVAEAYNANSVSSLVRDMIDHEKMTRQMEDGQPLMELGDALPEALRGALKITTKISVGNTKS